MFEAFLSKLKVLFNSPMILFIYGIISKWYVMVMVTAVVVMFWVLKGLTEAGVLSAAEKVVSRALKDTKSVARYCVPKINNLREFWGCLENPPDYEKTQDEGEFEKGLNDLLDFQNYEEQKDPYAQ